MKKQLLQLEWLLVKNVVYVVLDVSFKKYWTWNCILEKMVNIYNYKTIDAVFKYDISS